MDNTVTCVGVNPEVIRKLNCGVIPIWDPGLETKVQRSTSDDRLTLITNLEEGIKQAEIAFICVETPPRDDASFDLSYVQQAAKDIVRYMQSDLIVVDKSTVLDGTADMVSEIINNEQKKHKVSYKVSVVSNPEFLKKERCNQGFYETGSRRYKPKK